MAIAEGKRLLLFVENGVEKEIGGLQGDYEYVPLDRNELGRALVHAMEYVLAVTTVPLSCTVDASGTKVDFKFGLGSINETIEEQIEKIKQDKLRLPNNPNVGLALARALEQKGSRKDGIAELEEVLRLFPTFATGHHELAHLLERDGRRDDALIEFQRALDLEPGVVKNYRCYGKALYQKTTQIADMTTRLATLEKASRLLERAIALGGESGRKDLQNDLFLVQDALRTASASIPQMAAQSVAARRKPKR